MQVNRKHFPRVIPDNDLVYLGHLEGVIDSVDELATMEVTKMPYSYKFRIAPSVPMYIPMLMEEILKFHNMFRIKLDLGKSIKTSSTIVYEISLDENSN